MSTILITGGSVGLGFAMAEHFVGKTHTVYVCARNAADLERAAAGLPGLKVLKADITSPADRAMLFDAMERAGDVPDILVNNAAITRAHDYTSPHTLESDRARDEIETNFCAPVEIARLFLDQRRRLGLSGAASIVNISTPGCLFPLDAAPLYSSTKAGLHMFTLVLRRQLRETAVKVIEVFPPSLDTGLAGALNVAAQAENGPDVIRAVAGRIVDGVLGGEEVILPHPQSETMYGLLVSDREELFERFNAGVRRRENWEKT